MKKGKKKWLIILLSILSVSIIGTGIILNDIFNRISSTKKLNSGDRISNWEYDLGELKEKLPKKHKNLFFSLSKEEFNNKMDKLISNVANLDDIEIKAELFKIINSVGDSHTGMQLNYDNQYPISFFEFKEGLYVVNVSKEYEDLYGKKLLSINNIEISKIRNRINQYISHDNKMIELLEFCNYLKIGETLQFIDVSRGDKTLFTFQDNNGKKIEREMAVYDHEKLMSTPFLMNDATYQKKSPLFRKNSNLNYWYEYLDAEKTLYVKYNSCNSMKDYSFKAFTKDISDVLDDKEVKRLVVDLRDNGGGNSTIFNPFISMIKKHPKINNKENFYVIIGRKTFSSAILNTMDLKKETNATIIGEPTAGKPNHYGEVKTLELSNVCVSVNYSTKYFNNVNENIDTIYPDTNIELKADDYFSGKDNFLQYILSQ